MRRLKDWVARALDQGLVAFDTETTSLDAMQAELVGASLALAPNEACYIPLAHRGGSDLFGSGLAPDQIPLREAIAILKPLLEDPGTLKIAQNAKYDLLVLARHGITVAPGRRQRCCSPTCSMRAVTGMAWTRSPSAISATSRSAMARVAGQGKSAVGFDQVSIEKAAEYAARTPT